MALPIAAVGEVSKRTLKPLDTPAATDVLIESPELFGNLKPLVFQFKLLGGRLGAARGKRDQRSRTCGRNQPQHIPGLLANGVLSPIEAPGSRDPIPLGINSRGQIFGYAHVEENIRSFLLAGGSTPRFNFREVSSRAPTASTIALRSSAISPATTEFIANFSGLGDGSRRLKCRTAATHVRMASTTGDRLSEALPALRTPI